MCAFFSESKLQKSIQLSRPSCPVCCIRFSHDEGEAPSSIQPRPYPVHSHRYLTSPSAVFHVHTLGCSALPSASFTRPAEPLGSARRCPGSLLELELCHPHSSAKTIARPMPSEWHRHLPSKEDWCLWTHRMVIHGQVRYSLVQL